MSRRKIEYLPLDDVRPHPDNPRLHESLPVVAEAVDLLGFIEPIVRDERTGQLVAGHGRVKVLTGMRESSEDPPEGVVVDDSGAWLVPVVVGWESRSDEDATRARIVLNRTAEIGGWDDPLLLAQLDALAATDHGLAALGFNEEQQKALRAIAEDSGGEPPEEFPEYDEDIPTDHECPKCGYVWSGGS